MAPVWARVVVATVQAAVPPREASEPTIRAPTASLAIDVLPLPIKGAITKTSAPARSPSRTAHFTAGSQAVASRSSR